MNRGLPVNDFRDGGDFLNFRDLNFSWFGIAKMTQYENQEKKEEILRGNFYWTTKHSYKIFREEGLTRILSRSR